MFRCSMFRRKSRTGPPSQRRRTFLARLFLPSMLDVRCSDVRCSAANLRAGHHLHDTSAPRLSSSSLRCCDVPMFRCSMFRRKSRAGHHLNARPHRHQRSDLQPLLFPSMLDVPMFRCSTFRRKSRAGHHLHDVAPSSPPPTDHLQPPAPSLPFPSMLDVPMFRCSMFRRKSRAGHHLNDPHRPRRHQPPTLPTSRPLLLPFDVGCSDVPMFDVPPQISRGSPSQRCRVRLQAGGLPARLLPADIDARDQFDYKTPGRSRGRCAITGRGRQRGDGYQERTRWV